MRNTAILPGKDRLEDMIASVDDGYICSIRITDRRYHGQFMFAYAWVMK
jgi:TldD protein